MITRESLEKLCRQQVKVLSKRKIHRQRFIYIVGLLFLSSLLLLPMLFHHNKSEVIPTDESENVTNYHSALEANLARLHQLRAGIAKTIKSVHLTQVANHPNRLSKLQKLRQHAPTRMYVADSSSASFSKNSSSTFMDKSPYARFANQSSQVPIIMAQRLAHPESTIPQGEFIHAILETAIDSDLPGMIRAVVARPVYSYRGDHLLIPEGSRLIGQYSSKTPKGVNRVMVVWQRILLPNGVSIQLDSPGSDALGEAGFSADRVNTHFFQRFGEASLLSLIGAAAANWGVNGEDSNNASQQYRAAIAQSFQSNASNTLQHFIGIKPTLQIHQGGEVIVFVARDLDFNSVMGVDNGR